MATLIIAVVYLAAIAIFNVIDNNRMAAQADAQLSEPLIDAHRGVPFATAVRPHGDTDVSSPPILLWRISSAGRTLEASEGAPPLPAAAWSRSGRPDTARVGTATFRLKAVKDGSTWLIAAVSLANTQHVQRVLVTEEAIAAPVLLVAVFLGTLVIGVKASGPVEQARRRQLEFTADASHELRTPLSVIEAETGLALSTRRDAGEYQDALQRVSRESHRLRRIVDDLLWLARFDSEPANPADEPVDVSTIAEVCADRFSAIARSRGIELSVHSEGQPQAWITAPPQWVDRLTGVLVDNACRYAGAADRRPAGATTTAAPAATAVTASPAAAIGASPDGSSPDGASPATAPAATAAATSTATAARGAAVRIVVAAQGSRVTLTVEDTGPGIPAGQRARLFDRFYRASSDGSGSGLGLAIADAVVRSTGGKWRVDESPLGGARMQVSWHRSAHRRAALAR
jgi:signal transduction histidine kinase